MERDESYFSRTLWFIWIGVTSSILMILMVGISLRGEWAGKTVAITDTADWIIDALIAFGLVTSVWLQLHLRKLMLRRPQNHHESLWHNGQIVLYYTLFLLSNEIFLGIGFYYGFILKDFSRFFWYSIATLVSQLVSVPKLALRKNQINDHSVIPQ